MEACMSALPFLIINLSGEMMYIIDQRLRAQLIITAKADRVKEDLTLKLVDDTFLETLFTPQKLYTVEACKKLFQDLTLSSIMKLSATSMEKLMDLMLMGVKMQTLCIKYPEELLHVTINHIESMISLVKGSSKHLLRSKLLARFVDQFSDYRPYHFAQLRRTLLDFFIDKSIRVSVLIAESMQFEDGSFYIDIGGEMPPGTGDVPRTVLVINSLGNVQEKRVLGSSPNHSCCVSTVRERVNERRTFFGLNIYADSRPALRRDPVVSRAGSPTFDRPSPTSFSVSEEESRKATHWELDILADFTGVNGSPRSTVTALQSYDYKLEPDSNQPVVKARVSARLMSLKAQLDEDDKCEEAKEDEVDFFS
jgi:hypothetical protein